MSRIIAQSRGRVAGNEDTAIVMSSLSEAKSDYQQRAVWSSAATSKVFLGSRCISHEIGHWWASAQSAQTDLPRRYVGKGHSRSRQKLQSISNWMLRPPFDSSGSLGKDQRWMVLYNWKARLWVESRFGWDWTSHPKCGYFTTRKSLVTLNTSGTTLVAIVARFLSSSLFT